LRDVTWFALSEHLGVRGKRAESSPLWVTPNQQVSSAVILMMRVRGWSVCRLVNEDKGVETSV
jgi:hypothetical protein